MATANLQQQRSSKRRRLTPGRILLLLIILGMIAASAVWYRKSAASSGVSAASTFTVMRGPMEITVLEGGSIEARESRQIKCEVQGSTKILKIVDEGYQITQEDVDKGLVLIELDSKQLVDQQVTQELEYQNSMAALTSAKEAYEIQINQNESELKSSELSVQLNKMDLEKYLGEELAEKICKEIETARKDQSEKSRNEQEALQAARNAEADAIAAQKESSNATEQPAASPEIKEKAEEPESEKAVSSFSTPTINLLKTATSQDLGDGDARQRMRQLENDLILAQQEVALSATTLEGTKRLFEKDFVTKNKLDNDQLLFNRKKIALETSQTNKDLFLKYEFPKTAQKNASNYEEALRKQERAQKVAVSQLAQSAATRNSSEIRYNVQARKRKELAEQIQKCTIRAKYTGMVVYGSGERSWHSEPIEEGSAVREQQVLLTIPDAAAMAVKVQVHESFVQKIQPGQKARIRVDSNPNVTLSGEVHRISVLPDSQNRWMNPDLKVYATIIYVDGNNDWLKPGMSAEAEIIVDQLSDVIQVPLQAVTLENNEQVCYVSTGLGHQRRVVETAAYSTAMIEITKGLTPGEKVLLRSPAGSEKEGAEKASKGAKGGGDKKEDKGKDSGEKKPEVSSGKDSGGAPKGDNGS